MRPHAVRHSWRTDKVIYNNNCNKNNIPSADKDGLNIKRRLWTDLVTAQLWRKGAEVYGNLEEGVSKCWTKTRRRKNGTGDRGQGCTG